MMKKNGDRIKDWKYAILLLCIPSLLLFGEGYAEQTKKETMEKKAKTIVCLGDSLTAGYQLHSNQAYPTLLQKMLTDANYDYTVINSGINGDTSSGALLRLESVIACNPDIVIVEIGANDGLHGHDLDTARKNLACIIETLQKKNIVVVFAGMRMVWSPDKEFVERFNRIFLDLAQQYDVIFMPFFLENVAMRAELNLPDMIHPNAAGYAIIAKNVYPYVEKAIRQREFQ